VPDYSTVHVPQLLPEVREVRCRHDLAPP
jgi:hypothetical protein